MLAKVLILATLAMIFASLISALIALYQNDDPSKRKRVVQALTLRVGLSMGLFVLLVLNIYLGFIPSRG